MRIISLFILALAVLVAPFGMGRMMDHANALHDMHASHNLEQNALPAHKSSAPNYMVCAACVAVAAQLVLISDPVALKEALDMSGSVALEGLLDLPPLPPPMSFIRTV
jgi:hypothetical protein